MLCIDDDDDDGDGDGDGDHFRCCSSPQIELELISARS